MTILGTIASSYKSAIGGGAWESIASITLGSDGTVTFSSIPATYRHLQVRCLVRGNRANHADGFNCRVNGYTTNSYGTAAYVSDNATFSAFSEANNSTFVNGAMVADASAGSWASSAIHTFLDYRNVSGRKLAASASSGYVSSTTYNRYKSTGMLLVSGETINSIFFFGSGGNFKAGSIFHLYGIKDE